MNLTATLQPAAVLVNAAANYTFSGPGEISGTGTLTKTNSGTLTLLTANDYSGVTILSQGILQSGNGTTSGSIGTNIVQDFGEPLSICPATTPSATPSPEQGNWFRRAPAR